MSSLCQNIVNCGEKNRENNKSKSIFHQIYIQKVNFNVKNIAKAY